MFKYFPTNYVWNLVRRSRHRNGRQDRRDRGDVRAAAGGRQAARRRRARTPSAKPGSKMADKLCALAEEDEARGRLISAGDKYAARGDLLPHRRAPAGA